MNITAPHAAAHSADDGKTKVMLVDDSAVIRGLIARALEADGSIKIVNSASNGQMAINAVKKADPDIIVLDIEMPVMDGLTALPLLRAEKPDAKIIICSTLSEKGAAISIKALSLGATECLAKPTSTGDMNSAGDFQQKLLQLIKNLGGKSAKAQTLQNTAERTPTASARQHNVTLRRDPQTYTGKPEIVAIGSSTGGPQALFTLLKNFQGFDVPIVITQHMPKTFTAILANHIHHNCGIPCHEGAAGMKLEPGHAYIAPGGFHMEFAPANNGTEIRISDGPQENYCKPSVEPMMRSVIKIYGNRVLAVILTGMGSDGLEGCRMLAQAGGRVIAQDEKTSVVWGMPGAVAMAGICTEVLPLEALGPWTRAAVMGVREA